MHRKAMPTQTIPPPHTPTHITHNCTRSNVHMNTSNRPSTRRRRAAIGSTVILALTLAAGSALAQNAQPRGQSRANPDAEQRERPALRGPAVNDDRPAAARRPFGEGNQPGMMGDRIPPGALRLILQDLSSPEAAEQLRLTPAQREAVEAHIADFQRQTREHMEQNREEMARIREAMRDRADSGNPQDSGPASERIRARMAELRESGPSPDQLFTRVWSELNQDQRALVQERLDTFRARAEAQREERYVRSRTGRDTDNNAAPDMRTPPQRPDPRAEGERRRPGMEGRAPDAMRERPELRPGQQTQRIDPERRERLIRAFARLSPEQQDRILQRLENLAEQEGSTADAPPSRRTPEQPPQSAPQRRGQADREAQPNNQDAPRQRPPQRRTNRD